MTVPYTFANQSGNVPASELDANFANVKASADTAVVVTANAQPNITSVGTLTSLSVTGDITANAFIGDGSQLTNLPLATNSTVGVVALGNGFTLNDSNQVTTSSLYNTNLTQPTQHYALRVDTNGVVILPDQSIINGSTLRAVAGSYAGLTTNDGENSWMWVDSTGAYIATQYNESGNSHQWTFDNTGNLTLPGNSEISINYANGQPYGGTGGANTGNVTFDNINIIGTGNLHLQPDPANAGSYLDIFLTSGPDLHLVASASANLILGKDDGANVMTSWNGNAYIQSWNLNTGNVGGVWTFGGDATLTAPGNINAVTASPAPSINGFDSINAVTLSATGNVYGTNIVAEAAFEIQVYNFTANVGGRYGVDTQTNTVTATLPASPPLGGAVFFADAAGAYNINNLIIDPNGGTIMGTSGNMTVSTPNQSVGLFYNGATWRIYNAG